jgi:hypothetical protein
MGRERDLLLGIADTKAGPARRKLQYACRYPRCRARFSTAAILAEHEAIPHELYPVCKRNFRCLLVHQMAAAHRKPAYGRRCAMPPQ